MGICGSYDNIPKGIILYLLKRDYKMMGVAVHSWDCWVWASVVSGSDA